MNSGFRTTIDQNPRMTTSLIGSGVQDVRVGRIHVDFVDSRILTDVQNFFPRLATVDRFVQSAISAFFPKRSLGSDVDDI